MTLSASCSAEKVGNAEACAPCTPNPECGNPPADPETPPGDPNDPGQPEADAGAPPVGEPTFCNEDQLVCNEEQVFPVGQFCSFGCCLVVLR